MKTESNPDFDLATLAGFPESLVPLWDRNRLLKSGMNAHQQAALYGKFSEFFEIPNDFEYLDFITLERLAFLLGEFEKPTVALSSSTHPYAVSSGEDVKGCISELMEKNSVKSAFSVGLNRTIDSTLSKYFLKNFTRFIFAPSFDASARTELEGEGIVCITPRISLKDDALQAFYPILGGTLIQDRDFKSISFYEFESLNMENPPAEVLSDLTFAARVLRHVRSLGAVLVSEESTLGIASGQAFLEDAFPVLEKFSNTSSVPKEKCTLVMESCPEDLEPFSKIAQNIAFPIPEKSPANDFNLNLFKALKTHLNY